MNDRDQGREDCEQGSPARQNASADYYSGYSEQYEREQIADNLTGDN